MTTTPIQDKRATFEVIYRVNAQRKRDYSVELGQPGDHVSTPAQLVRVQLQFDVDRIGVQLGERASKSKARRAKALAGAIVCTVLAACGGGGNESPAELAAMDQAATQAQAAYGPAPASGGPKGITIGTPDCASHGGCL